MLDQTGLKGAYDFQLDVGLGSFGRKVEGGGGDGPAAAIVDNGPTIFSALEQIGLKLESRKIPISVIVIDHVEPPTEN